MIEAIKTLRRDAVRLGDAETVARCDRAIGGDRAAKVTCEAMIVAIMIRSAGGSK